MADRTCSVQTRLRRHDRATVQAMAEQDDKPVEAVLAELIEEALDVRRVNALEEEQ